MADKTKTRAQEHDGVCAKAQELLAQFSSTVFGFDTSGDTRYIRCDFPQCKEHAEASQGKRCWLLHTMKNVKVLERHVGKEVHDYMKEKDSGTDDQVVSSHYVESQSFLEKQQLPEGTRKVLAVFNLKDPQSQFGDWMSLFFKAAFMAEGMRQNDCVVITQNFVSRQELMECIAKLKFLSNHWPTVEVVIVLSCHSSCQGQVFSCTPIAIGKQAGFEEFCSLHDFVMACQSVLKDTLMAIHISSCFTLKLDCSHADWPVDADWFKTKLRSSLCGSTKEVYETGSQVADLHLMLSTMIPSIPTGTCGTRLRDAVNRACSEGFPDLAMEMGLAFLGSDNVDEKLLTEGKEDEVTPPGLVVSSMRLVFLVEDEFSSGTFQESDNSKHSGSYVALADALVANLQMRKASDVKFEFMILRIKHGETSLVLESMKNHLDLLPCDTYKVLFIALGPMFSRPKLELIKLIMEWNDKRTGDICYGIHFQHVTAMQAYVIKNRLKEIQGSEVPGTNMEKASHGSHLAVTGLIENDNRNYSASFPVLLYMIHLAVGENGNRLAGKGIPSAVYSKKPVGHGMSSWTLEEVYMETCHVLSGLSRKCGLHLLSPASNPVQTTSATGTFPRGLLATSNEPSILESSKEEGTGAVLAACGPPRSAPHQEPADPSCNLAFPTKECEITRDGNPLELFHDENIDVFNANLVTGNEPSTAMYLDKQPSNIGTGIIDTSFSQENKNNRVSGSDCQPLTANEISGGATPSTINTDMSAESSSVGTGNIDVSMFNITSVSPSSATSPFEEVSILAEEEGDRMKAVDNEDGVDERPGRATCYESSSLIFGLTSSLESHVSVRGLSNTVNWILSEGIELLFDRFVLFGE